MKDEITVSHKENQRGAHTDFPKDIVEEQPQKLVFTVNKEELAHENSQKKEEEEYYDAMLSNWNKETELLEILMRKPKSEGEENTTITCSQVPRKENFVIASKEARVNFNFQINLKEAGTRSDENKYVIKDI
jgi:hypothetical protein